MLASATCWVGLNGEFGLMATFGAGLAAEVAASADEPAIRAATGRRWGRGTGSPAASAGSAAASANAARAIRIVPIRWRRELVGERVTLFLVPRERNRRATPAAISDAL